MLKWFIKLRKVFWEVKRYILCTYEAFASFCSCKSLGFVHILHPDPLSGYQEEGMSFSTFPFPPALCSVLFAYANPFSCHFRAPGKCGVFLSANLFVEKTAQQTDQALSGLSQFPISGARCVSAHLAADLGVICGWIQGPKVMFSWGFLLHTPWSPLSLCAVEKNLLAFPRRLLFDFGLFCSRWRPGGGSAGQR